MKVTSPSSGSYMKQGPTSTLGPLLSIAVGEGRNDAVKTLLELGAEENYILRGSIMLRLAQRNGHTEIEALPRARQ